MAASNSSDQTRVKFFGVICWAGAEDFDCAAAAAAEKISAGQDADGHGDAVPLLEIAAQARTRIAPNAVRTTRRD